MIRRESEMTQKHYEHMRDGKLSVDARVFLEASESYGAGSFFGCATMPPGASIGYHRHDGEFEIYYILRGRAKVVDNGQEAVLGPGDIMQCRDGDCLSSENIGELPLVFLAMVLRCHPAAE